MASGTAARNALVDHLAASTGLPGGVAARVVDEVVEYFAEPLEAYVRRRHTELRRVGLGNEAIFDRVAEELEHRLVQPPRLSTRQLRRLVYG